MQNLTRKMAFLAISALLFVPVAAAQDLSAGGLVDLSATADVQAKADASGAFRAVDAAKSHVDGARAELEARANELRYEAEARAEATLEQTEAQAEAGAEASMSFGARAVAEIQGAIEQVKEFVANLAVHAEADADAGAIIEG